ncbi:hypothetical protein [Streptomyces sp. NPDC058989]|uniref:hypothetical protein n=1 Tax=Streptomyces sp. NPDC058989 TaxID=3346686 RepID=UPI00367B569E
MQQASLLPRAPGLVSRPRTAHFAQVRDLPWLIALAVVFTAGQLYLALTTPGLGWDETVYVSQVDAHAPAAFFSAPRARGVTLLLAPAAVLTTSATALHCYLAVLSGAAFLLTLCLWRRLLPAPVPALGGALFAGLWVTLFYGPQVMPNLWTGYAALVATGCFLLAVRQPSAQLAPQAGRGAAVGVAAAVALAALMRPLDGVWLALPLFAAAVCVPAWRRSTVLLAIPAGLALGCAEWVVEAYVSYGGLVERLRQAGGIQGGLGWHPSFGDHARALQGKTLCRPCDMDWTYPVTAGWWFALPLAVAGAVWASARAREPGGTLHRYGPVWPTPRGREPGGRRELGLEPVRMDTFGLHPLRAVGLGLDGALQPHTPVWPPSLRDPGGARHRYGPGPIALPALVGLCLAAPYLLTVDYAAPRFLLPAYALLLLPAAWFLYWMTLLPRRRHAWAVAVLAIALLGHEAMQLAIVHKMQRGTARAQADIGRIGDTLRAAGVRPPCAVSGEEAVRVAYQLGCASRQPGGHDASITPAGLTRLGARSPAAVVLAAGEAPPGYARGWRPVRLPSTPGLKRLNAYVSPAARP